jgi:hypothetical protein
MSITYPDPNALPKMYTLEQVSKLTDIKLSILKNWIGSLDTLKPLYKMATSQPKGKKGFSGILDTGTNKRVTIFLDDDQYDDIHFIKENGVHKYKELVKTRVQEAV